MTNHISPFLLNSYKKRTKEELYMIVGESFSTVERRRKINKRTDIAIHIAGILSLGTVAVLRMSGQDELAAQVSKYLLGGWLGGSLLGITGTLRYCFSEDYLRELRFNAAQYSLLEKMSSQKD